MDIFVKNGILALANVVECDRTGWIQGHVGVSLLAGSALLKSGVLPKASYDSLKSRLQKQIEKYEHLLKPLESSQLTSDYTAILNAIELNTRQLSRSGHGVIYGALFLKAISNNDINVSEITVSNIAKLIVNCTEDNWGRYFGLVDYRQYKHSNLTEKDIRTLCSLAVTRSSSNVYLDTSDYFFAGEKIHGITHAHAVFILNELGYTDLASKAASQLLIQLDLNDLKPDSGLKLAQPKRFELSDPTLWGVGFNDEHQIKLAQSYSELSTELNIQLSDIDDLWGAVNS
ncbi:hypothetical protein L4D09_00085 [Photobacterium makurazakiensis]|uniref:hypothetical protein n=1 Tax=Photobacterium makurazakiensis TaxID=2910234 RepID=UPI003D14C48F